MLHFETKRIVSGINIVTALKEYSPEIPLASAMGL